MKIKTYSHVKTRVVLELEEWEARDLKKILARIGGKESIRKSEFTMREKVTGRKLLDELRFELGDNRG